MRRDIILKPERLFHKASCPVISFSFLFTHSNSSLFSFIFLCLYPMLFNCEIQEILKIIISNFKRSEFNLKNMSIYNKATYFDSQIINTFNLIIDLSGK